MEGVQRKREENNFFGALKFVKYVYQNGNLANFAPRIPKNKNHGSSQRKRFQSKPKEVFRHGQRRGGCNLEIKGHG